MLRSTKGFTLIELLIVVVIIGILAAIAIPKFANTREKAYVSSMKSDLRNLMTSEEIYYSDNNNFTYTSNETTLGFVESSGVSVAISNVSSTGWSAVATHSGTAKTCGVYWGGSPAQAPATQPGVVACT
ncbi:MAG: prepilin-type N-terminal cleavage/methylation domain-containing protein [Gemmatimonadetes bacterium]|nr:prepilin-type N-terminal cleavage/methylation domain-containing protein [Gemmatimonadota bacterium]